MSLFTRFSVFCFLVFGNLAIVMLSSPLRAQDWRANWEPRVGDIFYFSTAASLNGPLFNGDTLQMAITKIDSNNLTDTTVTLGIDTIEFQDSVLGHIASYYYHRYIFAITRFNLDVMPDQFPEGRSMWYVQPAAFSLSFGFPNSNQLIVQFEGKSLHIFSDTLTWSADVMYGPAYGTEQMSYTPELRWIYEFAGQDIGSDGRHDNDQQWNETLISAQVTSAGVQPINSDEATRIIVASGGYLLTLEVNFSQILRAQFQLLDPLGRPIRSWQMPVDAGERQISLNVADVPSGVYFLRISGEGIDEVKKVCIAH